MKRQLKEIYFEEVKEHAIEKLQDLKGSNIYGADLHHELFNIDYYIIGRYNAKKWLSENVFDVIGCIQEYEEDNFGKVNTDLTEPENVVNMFVYILGEEILQESNTLYDNWNNILSDDDMDNIIKDLKNSDFVGLK